MELEAPEGRQEMRERTAVSFSRSQGFVRSGWSVFGVRPFI